MTEPSREFRQSRLLARGLHGRLARFCFFRGGGGTCFSAAFYCIAAQVSAPLSLNADKTAFVTLMRHLKQVDSERRTVLLMQVENESGIIGSVRDDSL